jgi:hypothetical protein
MFVDDDLRNEEEIATQQTSSGIFAKDFNRSAASDARFLFSLNNLRKFVIWLIELYCGYSLVFTNEYICCRMPTFEELKEEVEEEDNNQFIPNSAKLTLLSYQLCIFVDQRFLFYYSAI